MKFASDGVSEASFDEYTRMTLSPEQQAALERVVHKASAHRPAAYGAYGAYDKYTQPHHRLRPEKRRISAWHFSDIGSSQTKTRPARSNHKFNAKNLAIIFLISAMFLGCGFLGWYYWWTEYTSFEYILQPIVVLEGQSLNPNEFLYRSEEMGNVSASYRNAGFRPVSGKQDVHLTLKRGWRSIDTVASLRVLSPVKQMKVEFAEVAPALTPDDFIANASAAGDLPYSLHFIEPPLPLEAYPIGEHDLHLMLNDVPFSVILSVVDETKPTAEAVPVTIKIGEPVSPEDFVKNCHDASGIKSISYYRDEPNVYAKINQIVEIKVEDNFGNYSVVNSELAILINTSPPVINGVNEIITFAGDPIIYSRGLTAFDDLGRDLTDEIEIDASNVDLNAVGIYKVRFWVTDKTGLRSDIAEAEVHVIDIDIEYVHETVDRALFGPWGIIKDWMSELQKAQAIFRFVRNNISYAPAGRPHTVEEGAYMALRNRQGNCYNYYSLSAVMLDRAGIENRRIERIEGTPTRHRWNLINPDGLGWHHFDTTPNQMSHIYGVALAFFTDSQAEDFTNRIYEINGKENYFTYDKSLYPEVVR